MRKVAWVVALVVLLGRASARAEEGAEDLGRALRPLLSVLDSRVLEFSVLGRVQARIDGREESIGLRYSRTGAETFDLEVSHSRYGCRVIREAGRTSLHLPRHGVVFRGEGAADGLGAIGSLDRLVSERTAGRGAVRFALDLYGLSGLDPGLAGEMARRAFDLRPGVETGQWFAGGDGRIQVLPGLLEFEFPTAKGMVLVRRGVRAEIEPVPESATVVPVDRAELERVLSRGFRRALEVLLPGPGTEPPEEPRVVELAGSPEQIGAAHARALREEALLCVDSTVHLAGLGWTLEKGRWFPDELRAAYARLAPHIPEAHRREVDALADGLGVDRGLLRLANVFPELFHCSGFAVFGSATADGKLYHGRVLDYMTEIGLQDCAVVFLVAPEGKRRFVNVGYAGFTGCVSGMNEDRISLGEMGGGGEGKWDGVPMATLMRRALEECGSLDEVIALWEKGPRTCEYYYVFADGKVPDAVGVAATPEALEVIRAGEGHPRLGEGIPDTVVLSAGGRLAELRRRILDGHGRIDAGSARDLMKRPVAMRSNLHNVLFCPRDLVLWVAQAGRRRPAAEMPYARIDFDGWLR